MTDRSAHEIEHGRLLAESGQAEKIWNWDTPAGRLRAGRRARLIGDACGLGPGMRVMEVGCGTGMFTQLFADSGAHILAVDISPDLLEIARGRELDPRLVSFRELRFEEAADLGPFDAIVGSSVLHHLDIPPALSVMYELLKSGGAIAFAEPNMLNPQVWAERHIPALRRRLHISPDETAIVRWRFERRLKEAGFVDRSIMSFDWLHPQTPPRLIGIVDRIGRILERLPLVHEFSGSVLIRARKA